jgi:CrcB protein
LGPAEQDQHHEQDDHQLGRTDVHTGNLSTHPSPSCRLERHRAAVRSGVGGDGPDPGCPSAPEPPWTSIFVVSPLWAWFSGNRQHDVRRAQRRSSAIDTRRSALGTNDGGWGRIRAGWRVVSDDLPAALPVDPDLVPVGPRPSRRRVEPGLLAVIAVGGMLGASARYGLTRWLPITAGRFPWATFWTNLAGSFVLGVVLVVVLERFPSARYGRYVRAFATTGVIGAFTTMSTYEVETALLLRDGHLATAVLYGLGSLVAGLGLAAAGIRVGRVGMAR